jgi:hypothetical protein
MHKFYNITRPEFDAEIFWGKYEQWRTERGLPHEDKLSEVQRKLANFLPERPALGFGVSFGDDAQGELLDRFRTIKDKSLGLVVFDAGFDALTLEDVLALIYHARRSLVDHGVIYIESAGQGPRGMATPSLLHFALEQAGFESVDSVKTEPESPSGDQQPQRFVIAAKVGTISENNSTLLASLRQHHPRVALVPEAQHTRTNSDSCAVEKHALREQIESLSNSLHQRNFQIQQIYGSTSWRLTWPMRIIIRLLRSPRDGLHDIALSLDVATRGKPALRKSLIAVGRAVGVTRDRMEVTPPSQTTTPTVGTPNFQESPWVIQPPRTATQAWSRMLDVGKSHWGRS